MPQVLNSPTRTQFLKEAWTGRGSFATVLLVLLVDNYGTDAFKWAPETIRMEIEDDYGLKLPQPNFDRLMTAIALLTSDDFYRSLPDFIHFCNILSGDAYDPRHWDPADAMEVAWGITEAMIIDPPSNDEPFDEEIRAYIGKVLDDEGIMSPPDILKLGLRDVSDLTDQVQAEFTDDPTMFAAIYQFEQGKTEDINEGIKRNLSHMAKQLEALPLRAGDARGVVMQMLRTLGRD